MIISFLWKENIIFREGKKLTLGFNHCRVRE